MYRISIIDGFCPRPYDERSLLDDPMGGTESAVTLLSEALAQHALVEVIQHCRRDGHTSQAGVCYRGRTGDCWRTEAAEGKRDAVIIINSPKILGLWRRHDPHCRLFLWRHNFLGNRHTRLFETLGRYDAWMVCVSDYHRLDSCRAQLAPLGGERTRVIPNPVQVHANESDTRDPNRLLFCSSPHKGLDEVIERFREVRAAIPSLQLRICNPGYLRDATIDEPGVCMLGALTRPALHAEMASALCVFYPQTRFQETFGLVGAEANALGTPLLAPACLGALPEVLGGEGQLMKSVDPGVLVQMLEHWRTGRLPRVWSRPEFDPRAVARRWLALIIDSDLKTPTGQRGAQDRVESSEIALPGEI